MAQAERPSNEEGKKMDINLKKSPVKIRKKASVKVKALARTEPANKNKLNKAKNTNTTGTVLDDNTKRRSTDEGADAKPLGVTDPTGKKRKRTSTDPS